MKTGSIPAVVPAPLDAASRLPPPIVDFAAVGSASGAVAAAAGSASSGGAGTDAGAGLGSGWSDVARITSTSEEGQRGRSDNAEAMAAQRITLSRMRIEALMLEAQMAAATADAERARAVARAVRTEAANIRQALRASLDSGQGGAPATSSDASSAVSRAQAAARKAAAEERQAAGDPALAPWQAAPSPRDSAAVENAPAGVPTSNLHRHAYEALRRAQGVLDELARVDWSRRIDSNIGDAERGLAAAGRAAAAGLVNALEDEDGALWGGYNGIA